MATQKKTQKNQPAGGRRPDEADRRRNGVREVGELLPRAGRLAFRRFGFSQGLMLARWAEIVGPVYARWSVPESLRPARGRAPAGGVLTVRVEGAFALQLQHLAPQLIDRVNRLLGAGTVGRLRLVQGEVAPAGVRRQPARPAPGDSNVAAVDLAGLRGIADSGLRGALEELAAQMTAGEIPPSVR